MLDDKSLYVPPIDYQINGIIGFPVIESLGRVTITRDGTLSATAKSDRQKVRSNLCLDQFKPLIEANYDNRPMIFLFDSGANTSTFYPAFYNAVKASMPKDSKPEPVKIGGAGGIRTIFRL